jgi:hypothetical protein
MALRFVREQKMITLTSDWTDLSLECCSACSPFCISFDISSPMLPL